jgi:Zn-dependent protease
MSAGDLIQKLRSENINKKRIWRSLTLTILSIIAFALISIAATNHLIASVLAITSALLLHELGHFVAMYMLGYQNLSLILIPLFGGVAIGKKHAAPVWQNAAVLMAGPLPGLLLGLTIRFFLPRTLSVTSPETIPFWTLFLNDFSGILVSFNAINLLPCVPLDGGRILQLMFGRNHFRLYVLFTIGSVLLGISVAFAVKMWPLAIIAGLTLFDLPYQARIYTEANRLINLSSTFTARLSELTEQEAQWLLEASINVNSKQWVTVERNTLEYEDNLLKTARDLHQTLVRQQLSIPGLIGLFCVYAAVCSLPFVTTFFPLSVTVVTNHPSP